MSRHCMKNELSSQSYRIITQRSIATYLALVIPVTSSGITLLSSSLSRSVASVRLTRRSATVKAVSPLTMTLRELQTSSTMDGCTE